MQQSTDQWNQIKESKNKTIQWGKNRFCSTNSAGTSGYPHIKGWG